MKLDYSGYRAAGVSPVILALARRLLNRERWVMKVIKELGAELEVIRKSRDLWTQNRLSPPTDPLNKPVNKSTVWTLKGPSVRLPIGGFRWAPFFKIPNVKTFKVEVSDVDAVFGYFGILKRGAPTIEYSYYRNRRALRYAMLMIQKLRDTTNHELYWFRVWVLMSRSVVFTMMALSKSFPRWHAELPLHLVMRWCMGSMKISRTWSQRMELVRVYIPKPGGRVRPLGVPSPVWRINMTLMNWFIVDRLMSRVTPPWQHGFLPGRGTKTAWSKILTEVKNVPNIYEFDIKGFFDNVKTRTVISWLHRVHGLGRAPLASDGIVKTNLCYLLYKLCVGVPAFPDQEIMSLTESERQGRALRYTRDDVRDADVVRSVQFPRRVAPLMSRGYSGEEPRGFPQGANISPFLSTSILSMVPVPAGLELLMYADDGLFYSQGVIDPYVIRTFFSDLGLEMSAEKSGMVRCRGKWLRPLRFLGMEWDGSSGILRSLTRSGRVLEYDQFGLVEAVGGAIPPGWSEGLTSVDSFDEYVLWDASGWSEGYRTLAEARYARAGLQGSTGYSIRISRMSMSGDVLVEDIDSASAWSKVALSRLFGFIQSRLYGGSWNFDMEQDFRLTYVPRSWVAKTGRAPSMNFANSTSFAFHDVAALIKRSIANLRWKKQYISGGMATELGVRESLSSSAPLEERLDAERRVLAYLNSKRRGIGFPPISGKYMRKFGLKPVTAPS